MRRFEHIQKLLQDIRRSGGLFHRNHSLCHSGRYSRQGRCYVIRSTNLGKIIQYDGAPFPRGCTPVEDPFLRFK
jgi:hypothetical protein